MCATTNRRKIGSKKTTVSLVPRGVLDNIKKKIRPNHAAEVFDALTDAGVPVEIVGLYGLLRLPEVAEIVAILHLMHDVTSNASLLTLLTGPRWAIGPATCGC